MKLNIDLSEKTLSFGKHKGLKLSQVPLSYLGWLLAKYEGNSLTREEIESEAIRRGCEKRNGHWGIEVRRSLRIKSGFDVDGIGYGNMYGVVETLRDDWESASCYDETYDYEGIPNTY